MHIITHSRLLAFSERHPDSQGALETWYRIMKKLRLTHFNELRQIFPSADLVGKCVVFNIGGNKARLIAAIHYNKGRVYIRHVLTHAEYNKNQWKRECDK